MNIPLPSHTDRQTHTDMVYGLHVYTCIYDGLARVHSNCGGTTMLMTVTSIEQQPPIRPQIVLCVCGSLCLSVHLNSLLTAHTIKLNPVNYLTGYVLGFCIGPPCSHASLEPIALLLNTHSMVTCTESVSNPTLIQSLLAYTSDAARALIFVRRQ